MVFVSPQLAHLVPVKSHSPSMSGSQSLHDQSAKGMSAFQEGLVSHRPEMPRQNSDPTSETPTPPPRVTSREEKFERSSWLRQEDDIPPKVRIRQYDKGGPNQGLRNIRGSKILP